jgi:Tfp pilus assembly PilM family ATPase
METYTIELTNQKAYKLLKELEELHIIRVLKKNVKPEQKLSDRFEGKLSPEIAEDLQNYVTQSRNEWDSLSI